MKILKGVNKKLYIIVLAGHEMTATKVYPFEFREPRRELIYNMYERAREYICTTFTMTVDMETIDI